MIQKRLNCIHCGEPMQNAYGNDSWSAPYCDQPDCANYKLLQAGI